MDEMDDEVATDSSPAWRWGLILAIALTALGILGQAISTVIQRQSPAQQPGQTTLTPVSVAVVCLSPMIELALIFCAGILAGREDGTVGAAARAGLFGVVISTFITTITQLVLFANTSQNVWSYLFATPELSRIATGAFILTTTCELIISGLFGMGVASLGGLIGRALYSDDEEAGPPPYPVYAGWDPAYGAPPYPPPDWNPSYGPPSPYGPYAPPPGYGLPLPDAGRHATEPPAPAPDVSPQ